MAPRSRSELQGYCSSSNTIRLAPVSAPLKSQVQVFNPQQEYVVVQRRLPHWSQAGTISFITWRTWDSMPQRVLNTWISERNAWLVRHGINPAAAHPPKEILADPELYQIGRAHV